MTPVIRILVFANIGVFLLQQMAADALFTHFALWPIGQYSVGGPVPVGFELWQLVTSAFLHAPKNFAHIAFNMFALCVVRHAWWSALSGRGDSRGCTRPRCFPRRWCNCWW